MHLRRHQQPLDLEGEQDHLLQDLELRLDQEGELDHLLQDLELRLDQEGEPDYLLQGQVSMKMMKPRLM